FTAVTWALLCRADRRLTRAGHRRVGWELAALPALLGLWANLHGGFLVGLGIVGLFAALTCARALAGGDDAPGPREIGPVLAAVALSTLAPIVNPYGVGLYRYLAGTLHLHHGVSEWEPVPLGDASFLRFKVLLLVAAVALASWWRTEASPERRLTLAWLTL